MVFTTAPQLNEVTHVLSKYEGAANRLAGIALDTLAVFTPNIPIPILDLLGGNVMPLTDYLYGQTLRRNPLTSSVQEV